MQNGRLEKKAKQRRYNRILNIFIGIVVALILYVGGTMLFGDDDSEKASTEEPSETKVEGTEDETANEDGQSDTGNQDESENNGEDAVSDETEEGKDEEESTEEAEEPTELPAAGEGEEVTSEYEEDPMVIQAVRGAWSPVPTQQSEPHQTQFDKESVDWKEMERAASYATGVDQSSMITWWIGNNGGEGKVFAVVSPGNKSALYEVDMVWVTNEGWKPEVVKQIDTAVFESFDERYN